MKLEELKALMDALIACAEACEATMSFLTGGDCSPQAERDLRAQLRAALRALEDA